MRGTSERGCAAVLAAVASLCAAGGPAQAATPPSGTITPDAAFGGQLSWSGTVNIGSETLLADDGLRASVPTASPPGRLGLRRLRARRRDDARVLCRAPGRGQHQRERLRSVGPRPVRLSPQPRRHARRVRRRRRPDPRRRRERRHRQGERLVLRRADAVHDVGPQTYSATATLITRQGTSLASVQAAAPKGLKNYRASRDTFTSHSEPTIAMDPLDHDHLMAGSKMYENNDKYLFKIGTYESFDGGRTWKDQGQLPGYCQAPGQCDPNNEGAYRTTSDVTIDFDDEGNAYANVLDAPGGTAAFQRLQHDRAHQAPGRAVERADHRPRQPRQRADLALVPRRQELDRRRQPHRRPRRLERARATARSARCTSAGASTAPTLPLQQIVVMRSRDGGKTWGGVTPGDNIPLPGQPEDADLRHRLPPRDRAQGRGLRARGTTTSSTR